MPVRRSPGVMNLADHCDCPSSSCNPDSFLALEHQRWRCSYACGIPLLSELAIRYIVNRSEICYSEDEPWCRCLLSPTREYIDSNDFIKVSVVLVIGTISLDEMKRISIILAQYIVPTSSFNCGPTHISSRIQTGAIDLPSSDLVCISGLVNSERRK
jgi:hypothetical protein